MHVIAKLHRNKQIRIIKPMQPGSSEAATTAVKENCLRREALRKKLVMHVGDISDSCTTPWRRVSVRIQKRCPAQPVDRWRWTGLGGGVP